MTLPANDAFTLGLTGNHDSTRPSYTISFRATSPKIPFMSKSSALSPTRSTRSRRRSMTNGVPNISLASPSRRSVVSVKTQTFMPLKDSQSKENGKPLVEVQRARIDWEIPRKTLHSSIGFLTLYLYTSHGSPRPVIIALSLALAVIIPTDILRLNHPGFEKMYERFLGFLMRESEKKSTNGVIWYIIGVIFVLSFYPLDVAVVAILILSWADTAASTIGRLWGRLTPPLPHRVPLLGLPFAPRKSVAGFLAGSVVGASIAAGFWGWVAPFGNIQPVWQWNSGVPPSPSDSGSFMSGWLGLGVISVVSGAVSGIAEALDLGSLDDNLTLPIISGGCIWGFLGLMSFLST